MVASSAGYTENPELKYLIDILKDVQKRGTGR